MHIPDAAQVHCLSACSMRLTWSNQRLPAMRHCMALPRSPARTARVSPARPVPVQHIVGRAHTPVHKRACAGTQGVRRGSQPRGRWGTGQRPPQTSHLPDVACGHTRSGTPVYTPDFTLGPCQSSLPSACSAWHPGSASSSRLHSTPSMSDCTCNTAGSPGPPSALAAGVERCCPVPDGAHQQRAPSGRTGWRTQSLQSSA